MNSTVQLFSLIHILFSFEKLHSLVWHAISHDCQMIKNLRQSPVSFCKGRSSTFVSLFTLLLSPLSCPAIKVLYMWTQLVLEIIAKTLWQMRYTCKLLTWNKITKLKWKPKCIVPQGVHCEDQHMSVTVRHAGIQWKKCFDIQTDRHRCGQLGSECTASFFVGIPIWLSTLGPVANDLLNDALRLDNELSALAATCSLRSVSKVQINHLGLQNPL